MGARQRSFQIGASGTFFNGRQNKDLFQRAPEKHDLFKEAPEVFFEPGATRNDKDKKGGGKKICVNRRQENLFDQAPEKDLFKQAPEHILNERQKEGLFLLAPEKKIFLNERKKKIFLNARSKKDLF